MVAGLWGWRTALPCTTASRSRSRSVGGPGMFTNQLLPAPPSKLAASSGLPQLPSCASRTAASPCHTYCSLAAHCPTTRPLNRNLSVPHAQFSREFAGLSLCLLPHLNPVQPSCLATAHSSAASLRAPAASQPLRCSFAATSWRWWAAERRPSTHLTRRVGVDDCFVCVGALVGQAAAYGTLGWGCAWAPTTSASFRAHIDPHHPTHVGRS